MKKLLVILNLLFSLICVQAQTSTELSLKLDSLQLKLDKLQHDHDFMSCEYKLSRLSAELQLFDIELNLKTHEIIRDIERNNHTNAIYQSYKMLYEQYVDLYQKYKLNIGATNWNISVMTDNSKFYEHEINVLKSASETIKQNMDKIQLSLEYQKAMLDCYKEMNLK